MRHNMNGKNDLTDDVGTLIRLGGQARTPSSERMDAAYPPESDGRTLLPYRRLFFVAIR